VNSMCDVAFITESRSEYSLMSKALIELKKYVDIKIIATGMHLSPHFGNTVSDIENDGFDVEKVDALFDSNSLGGMLKTMGMEIYGITQVVEKLNPKLIFVEGDRCAALVGALIGAHLNIPVVHHGGGDVSDSIDNKLRNATSIFANYHLVGNLESYINLLKMGIDKNKIFVTGEPGIDDIILENYSKKDTIIEKYGIKTDENLLLLIFHPNTNENEEVKTQIKEILDAILELNIPTISVYSNSDAGGTEINKMLDEYSKKSKNISVYAHISRKDFLGLMNLCSAMVGNSSSGLVELPSFKKPFVNIGNRQKGRLKTKNVIETNFDKTEIKKAVHKAIYDENFKKDLNNLENPYGKGKSYSKINEIILKILNNEM